MTSGVDEVDSGDGRLRCFATSACSGFFEAVGVDVLSLDAAELFSVVGLADFGSGVGVGFG